MAKDYDKKEIAESYFAHKGLNIQKKTDLKKAVAFTFCNQRTNFKYPQQSHEAINEFFELLQKPGIAEVKVFSLKPNIA